MIVMPRLDMTIAIETHGGITFDDDGDSVSTDPDSLIRLICLRKLDSIMILEI